jgi:iron complex transport system substrate-binding protein
MKIQIFGVSLLILLTGCGKELTTTNIKDTKEFTDDLGRKVAVPKHPKRIVCLATADVEIIFSLGKKDCLVGRPSFQEYPKEALMIEPVGSMYNPNLEKIIALHPDLIILSATINEGVKRSIKRFEEFKLCLVVFKYPESIFSILNHIEKIGDLVGASGQAKKLVKNIKRQIEKIKKKVAGLKRYKVYVEHSYGKIAAAGKKSRENELIKIAGGINIFNDINVSSAQVNFEEVIKRNPEVIIRVESPEKLNDEKLKQMILEEIKNRPGWESISAVRNGKIYLTNWQHTWAGPRIINGLYDFARCIHPEIFCKAKSN